MNKLVIGQGLLGSEIVRQTGWSYVSRKEHSIDFNDISTYNHYLEDYEVIINCVAITDTYGKDREIFCNTNYKAVADLSDFCKQTKKKLVHISTDYVYAGSQQFCSEEDLPVISPNWYTYYKLLADEYIMLKNLDYLICRCSFKPNPFPYNKAWIDHVGNFDYVDEIAKLIIKLVESNGTGLFNVGTELKSIYELAKKTNESVCKSFKLNEAPSNISIDLSKLNRALL